MRIPESEPPNLKDASDYEKFVARHRLVLSLTIEGLDCSLKRWDSLCFDSITEPVGSASGVPPLFAMLNVMKSDFLAARYLAYQALTAKFPDSGFYTDTLDYAVYGIAPSLLSLAQRACIDVLDKIAAATTEYLAFRVTRKSSISGVDGSTIRERGRRSSGIVTAPANRQWQYGNHRSGRHIF